MTIRGQSPGAVRGASRPSPAPCAVSPELWYLWVALGTEPRSGAPDLSCARSHLVPVTVPARTPGGTASAAASRRTVSRVAGRPRSILHSVSRATRARPASSSWVTPAAIRHLFSSGNGRGIQTGDGRSRRSERRSKGSGNDSCLFGPYELAARAPTSDLPEKSAVLMSVCARR
jgi:hypothetical protein